MTTVCKNEYNTGAKDIVDLGLVRALLNGQTETKGNLIFLLQGTQNLYGYLPAEALKEISLFTGNSLSSIYSVATFYSQFRLQPAGKNIIRICHGTACHVQNTNAVTIALYDELGISDGGTTPDSLFTLETVACLGCCSLAPVMMIGEDTYGNLTPQEAVKVIKGIRRREGAQK